jgi:hypothetical protein
MKTLLDKLNLTYLILTLLGIVFTGVVSGSVWAVGLRKDMESLQKSVAKIESKMDNDYFVTTFRYDRETDLYWLEITKVESKLENHIINDKYP